MNAESAVEAEPDVVLMLTKCVESIGGESAIWRLPGIKLTPAGKNKKIIIMDDLLLLGFTGRLGDAAIELAKKLYRR